MHNSVNMCPVDYVAACTVRIGTEASLMNGTYHMVNPERYAFPATPPPGPVAARASAAWADLGTSGAGRPYEGAGG